MYHVIVKDKPNRCCDCPLKDGLTRDCGEIIKRQADSSGMYYDKIPNKRCKIKYYQPRIKRNEQNTKPPG